MRRPLRLNLVLVGFGHVGRRLAGLLDERRARLVREESLALRTVGIVTGRHGSLFNPHGIAAARIARELPPGGHLESIGLPLQPGWQTPPSTAEFIRRSVGAVREADPAARVVVVETTVLDITAGQPAIDHVRAGLECGAHVVTANKGPAAFAWRELSSLAATRGLSFLCEGAVMDGVPVFNLVRATLPAASVVGFSGVVNSTTNHILSAMEQGREFDAALAEMQAAGITEADPSLDVDGWDAAAKTAALANVLMDASITPHDVDRRGIAHLGGAEVRAALAGGRRWKLVASATLAGGKVHASVAPRELPATEILARLEGQQNALVLETDLLGRIAIVQLDSGLTQTAYALLSDLVTLRRRLDG